MTRRGRRHRDRRHRLPPERRALGAPCARTRPLVAGVARHVANVRVRSVGTVGGNLAFADPHSDLATLFLVFDARVRPLEPRGRARAAARRLRARPLRNRPARRRDPDGGAPSALAGGRGGRPTEVRRPRAPHARRRRRPDARLRTARPWPTRAWPSAASARDPSASARRRGTRLRGAASPDGSPGARAELGATGAAREAIDAVDRPARLGDYKREMARVLRRPRARASPRAAPWARRRRALSPTLRADRRR